MSAVMRVKSADWTKLQGRRQAVIAVLLANEYEAIT